MLKKIFAYQRLLLNSISSDGIKMKSRFSILIYIFIVFIIVFMGIVIFSGDISSLNPLFYSFFYITLPVISICFIDIIFYKGDRIFENVPVKRGFIVFNIFLFSIILTVILYLMLTVSTIALVWLLIGVFYIFLPSHISNTPPEAVNQIIDTAKANHLMLMVVVLILFVGTSIVFIKNKKIRISCFTLSSAIGYGLLFLLKINMPLSPNSGKIEFFESFTLMPSANTVLMGTALGTVLICFISAAAGYKLYGDGS